MRHNIVMRRRSYSRFAILLVIASASSTADIALAASSSRPYGAVVCSSEAGGAWTMKAQGTLTRTKTEGELIYRFESAGHSFDWRFVASPQGHTTALGPGFLMERFGGASQPAERRQSIEATGEIREYAGRSVLVLLIGTKCPAARRA